MSKNIKFRFELEVKKYYSAEVCAKDIQEAREKFWEMKTEDMEHLNGRDEFEESGAEMFDDEVCDDQE